jgi:hypothetical protein
MVLAEEAANVHESTVGQRPHGCEIGVTQCQGTHECRSIYTYLKSGTTVTNLTLLSLPNSPVSYYSGKSSCVCVETVFDDVWNGRETPEEKKREPPSAPDVLEAGARVFAYHREEDQATL